jgi:hypothetical protein
MTSVLDRLWHWSPGGWRRLNPFQRRALLGAIQAGYTNPGLLAQFTSTWLNVNLADVTPAAEYPVMVDRLITWAEAANRLDELLEALAKDKPDNPNVVNPVTRIRQDLPLAARRVGEEDTPRPYWSTNARLAMLITILATAWLLATLSTPAALFLLGLALVVWLSALTLMPVLAGPARRAGRVLFAFLNHPRTTYGLMAVLIALLFFVYPFVGVLRVEVGSLTDPDTPRIDLIRRSRAAGDGLPLEHHLGVVSLLPGHWTVRPYLTWPFDQRELIIRAGYREAVTPIGPWRRTVLAISDQTPFRKLPRLLIAPTKDLFEAVFNQDRTRLAVTIDGGEQPDWIEPYKGQLVWIAPGPPDSQDRTRMQEHFGYVFRGLAPSEPVIRLPHPGLTLEPNIRIMIELEIKKVPSNDWRTYDKSYPRNVVIQADPSEVQEVLIDAK